MEESGSPLEEAISRWGSNEYWMEYQERSNSLLGRERRSNALHFQGPFSGLINRQYSQVQEQKRALFEKALLPLIEKLSSGELIATGILAPRRPRSKRVVISPEIWTRLDTINTEKSDISADGMIYHAVRVAAQLGDEVSVKTVAPISDREAIRWYTARIAYFQDQGKIPSRADDLADAKLRFGARITKARVLDLRSRLAPPEWKQRGRRRL